MEGWLSDELDPSLDRAMAGCSSMVEGDSGAEDEDEALAWANGVFEAGLVAEALEFGVLESGEVATSVSLLGLVAALEVVVVVVVVEVTGE